METTLGERFKQIRKKSDMTQKDFAESLGVTQATISGIEKNAANTSLTMAKLISLKYGINENWILTGKGEMEDVAPEWDIEGTDGLMEKYKAMKLMLDNNLETLKVNKDNLFCAVESFSFFTSIIGAIDSKDTECSTYLNLIYQYFDELEKYIFKYSYARKNKKINIEDMCALQKQEIKLQNNMLHLKEKILSELCGKTQ